MVLILFTLGMYIPYITKTYFGTPNPPVRLAKFAIGGRLSSIIQGKCDLTVAYADGAIGSEALFEDAPVVTIASINLQS